MSITPFSVLHKNPEAQNALGLGYVVGEVQRKTQVQTKGTIERDGAKVPALITEEKIVVYYQVLWENARDVSPSLHKATDLQWENILLASDTDDIDDEEELDEEEDNEAEQLDFNQQTLEESADADEWSETDATLSTSGDITADENADLTL